MKNVLTIDVEDWYQGHDFHFAISKWASFEDRVTVNTERILDLLSQKGVKATFFVLGCVAERHPELVRRIAREGHEIGSHGYWHQMVSTMTEDEFRQDLVRTRNILEQTSGQKISLYRAPSWSITRETFWVLEILEDEGFLCDSSIQPFRTPLSGINGMPVVPFHPVINGKRLRLVEYPPTVLQLNGLRIPFSGGLYLRILPLDFVSWALKKQNTKKKAGMIYVHPWEIDTEQPRLSAPAHIKFVHYYNLSSTFSKLERLIERFAFVPLGELIQGSQFPDIAI